MIKRIVNFLILFILLTNFKLVLAQILVEPKLLNPSIQLPYKVRVEKVVVSNEIPIRFTICLKNNSEKTMTLENYKVEVIIFSSSNKDWIPKLILESPSGNPSIMPGQSINLVYKTSKEEVLNKIDEERLTINASNKIRVNVYIKGEEGQEYSRFFYEDNFFWKPQIADLAIKDAKVEFLGYDSNPYYKRKLKVSVSIKNIGDAYPILYGDNKKLNESLVQIKMVRKKDGKYFYLQMESVGKSSISEYTFGPGNQIELSFISRYPLPDIDTIGDFDIIISFDEEIDKKTNTTYYHLFSDGNRQNNIFVTSLSFNEVFDLGAFYPKKVSILKPAGVKREYPRLEQDLMYIDVKSYVKLNLIDEISTIKVYFNNEPLRIFNITIGYMDSYRVWFEKPKKVGKGKIKVELLGITRFSKDDLEVTDSFIFSSEASSSDISWPFYFTASPDVYLLYFGKDDPKPPYGATPISIDDISIKGNAPINISIALRSPQITWFDISKGLKDIPPNADLRYYAWSNRYAVRVYIRPSNKIKWRFLEHIEAPVTIEPNKRPIITIKLDELEAFAKGDLTSGENELLIQVIYTFETKEKYVANQEVKEVVMKHMILSDMYWTRFKI
ncbi:MAG: hypothetical protein N2380_01895 [bacterium]|nr:hypothetical protein [bacterium]